MVPILNGRSSLDKANNDPMAVGGISIWMKDKTKPSNITIFIWVLGVIPGACENINPQQKGNASSLCEVAPWEYKMVVIFQYQYQRIKYTYCEHIQKSSYSSTLTLCYHPILWPETRHHNFKK